MSANAPSDDPLADEMDQSESKAVLDRILDAAEACALDDHQLDEDEASASTSSDEGRSSDSDCLLEQDVVPDVDLPDVDLPDDFDYSIMPTGQEFEDWYFSEADDDDYNLSDIAPSLSSDDDFLPRDPSEESLGDREGRLLAEIEFLERMIVFFTDHEALEFEVSEERRGGGDHAQE